MDTASFVATLPRRDVHPCKLAMARPIAPWSTSHVKVLARYHSCLNATGRQAHFAHWSSDLGRACFKDPRWLRFGFGQPWDHIFLDQFSALSVADWVGSQTQDPMPRYCRGPVLNGRSAVDLVVCAGRGHVETCIAGALQHLGNRTGQLNVLLMDDSLLPAIGPRNNSRCPPRPNKADQWSGPGVLENRSVVCTTLAWRNSLHRQLLNLPAVRHVFAHNPSIIHPKLSPYPLGVPAYEYMGWLHKLDGREASTSNRNILLMCDGISVTTDSEREHKLDQLRRNGFNCAGMHVEPAQYLDTMLRSKFVFSPRGHGKQNFRDWEALTAGAVPVMDQVPATLAALYDKLPVVMVTDWKVVTPQFLHETWTQIHRRASPKCTWGKDGSSRTGIRCEAPEYDMRSIFTPFWFGQLVDWKFDG